MSLKMFEEDVIYAQRFLKSAGLYTGEIDGIWGPLTDAADMLFNSETERLAAELGSFHHRTEEKVRTLQIKAQEAARRFMSAVVADGIDARIISGTRSYEEQNKLFRQGRFGNPGPIVTRARGGQSNHNFGIAWDIGIFDGGAYLPESPLYERAAEVGLAEGLEWGGNWTRFVDRPHYQLGVGLLISQIRARFEAGEPYFGDEPPTD